MCSFVYEEEKKKKRGKEGGNKTCLCDMLNRILLKHVIKMEYIYRDFIQEE